LTGFSPKRWKASCGRPYTDFEFVIVDFGLTDDSKSIISRYAANDDRIKFHEIPVCTLPVARNAGCSLARGEYIAVMDADDVCLPDRLKLEVEFMQKHPKVALLGGAVEWIDATCRPLGAHHHPTGFPEITSELTTHCTFWHPTILMRKEAFVAVGGYRGAFVYAHDYDLELRVADKYECANLSDVVLKYRIHSAQVTLQKQRQQTLCKLAARTSASSRKSDHCDPIGAVSDITPALLEKLGIDSAAQEKALVSDCWVWVRSMTAAREYTAALNSANLMLESKHVHVERWLIADLQLLVAQLYWKQGRFLESLLTACHAVITRPLILGRPFRLVLGR
jgi:glycosyltransferase involved in cell wall biosynthesis